MRDWRGTEIEVGSRVIYPVRMGSSMWMTEIEVTEVIEDGRAPGQSANTGFIRGRTQNSSSGGKEAAEKKKLVVVSAIRRVTVL
jgi:hypothetical protein